MAHSSQFRNRKTAYLIQFRIQVAVAFRQFSNLFARSGAGGMLGGKRKKTVSPILTTGGQFSTERDEEGERDGAVLGWLGRG